MQVVDEIPVLANQQAVTRILGVCVLQPVEEVALGATVEESFVNRVSTPDMNNLTCTEDTVDEVSVVCPQLRA